MGSQARLLFIISLFVSTPIFASDKIEVENAWIREAPPTAKVMAGYMIISNNSDDTVMLNSVTSEGFGRVEFHRTEMRDGMATMIPITHITIKPHGKITFEPGGLHLMLINPKKPIKADDTVTLNLKFSDELVIPIVVSTKKGHGMEDHSMHDMQHEHNY